MRSAFAWRWEPARETSSARYWGRGCASRCWGWLRVLWFRWPSHTCCAACCLVLVRLTGSLLLRLPASSFWLHWPHALFQRDGHLPSIPCKRSELNSSKNPNGEEHDDQRLARHSLCATAIAQVAGLHDYRGAYAGAGHRRQYRHLHAGSCDPDAVAAGGRPSAALSHRRRQQVQRLRENHLRRSTC